MHLDGKPIVMVVDDDPSHRSFLESFLAERGYHAVSLGNAADAIQHFQQERPAAVILDL